VQPVAGTISSLGSLFQGVTVDTHLGDGYLWGLNKCQIGGQKSIIKKAKKLTMLAGIHIRHIECGPSQIAILDTSDDLYMLGKQLSTVWSEPTKLLSNVAEVSCGKDFTLMITRSGQLYVCGLNTLCQSTKETKSYDVPRRVSLQHQLSKVSASDNVAKAPTLLLTKDMKSVIAGTKLIKFDEPCVQVSSGYVLTRSGALYQIINNHSKQVETQHKFCQISCSASNCLALTTQGQLYQFQRDSVNFNRLK
jgi:alpha-tubulin suppressor-like RCC1 family protein